MGYIWGSDYDIPKAIFYLLKGDYMRVWGFRETALGVLGTDMDLPEANHVPLRGVQ